MATYTATMSGTGYVKLSSSFTITYITGDTGTFTTCSSVDNLLLSSMNWLRNVDISQDIAEFTTCSTVSVILDSRNDMDTVALDIVTFTVDTPLYIESDNVMTFIDVDALLVSTFTMQQCVRLSSGNVVAWPSVSDSIYTTSTSGTIILSSDVRNYLVFVDVEDITYTVTQGVTGLRLSSDNIVDLVDMAILVSEFTTQHRYLELSGEMTYGRYDAPVVAFEVNGELVLIGKNSVRTGIEAIYDAFETWVLNGHGFDVSIYSNWNFNSYAKHGETYYAAASDGIYILEGDSDNNTKIHSGVRCGPHHFNLDNKKYIRTVKLGPCGDETQVRVSSPNIPSEITVVATNDRFVGSRFVEDRDLTIDVQDFDQLEYMDIRLMAKQRN